MKYLSINGWYVWSLSEIILYAIPSQVHFLKKKLFVIHINMEFALLIHSRIVCLGKGTGLAPNKQQIIVLTH